MATVKQLVDAFLDQVREERKPSTLQHYSKRIKPFVAAFGARDFASLTPLEIRAYITAQNRFPEGDKKAGQLKAAATRASNAIVLQLLESFAIENREIGQKLLPKLEIPTGARREELPTEEEARKILAAGRPAFALAYRAMRQSGARPSELVNATIADWDKGEGEIVLTEHKTDSTGTKRRIAVGKKLKRILDEATAGRTEGPLFLNTEGQPWTVSALSKAFSRLRDRTGCRKCIVLYCERHYHATKLCERASIDDAANALGHKSINTTRRYIHKVKQVLRDNQDLIDEVATDLQICSTAAPGESTISHEMDPANQRSQRI